MKNYVHSFECASKTVEQAFCKPNPLDAKTEFIYLYHK